MHDHAEQVAEGLRTMARALQTAVDRIARDFRKAFVDAHGAESILRELRRRERASNRHARRCRNRAALAKRQPRRGRRRRH